MQGHHCLPLRVWLWGKCVLCVTVEVIMDLERDHTIAETFPLFLQNRSVWVCAYFFYIPFHEFNVVERIKSVSWVGRKGGTKVLMYGRKSPWVATLTELFPKIQADAGSWLGTKNALYYCAQSANSFSWVLFVSSYTTAIVSITACLAHAPKKCTQSGNFQFDIKSPSDFKILSARKLKTLFQKYKLELTTGIHACIGHASDAREFLKDTTTADSHENVTWKSEFTFFQSLSWLFQLACFVKCKWTLLELNFY